MKILSQLLSRRDVGKSDVQIPSDVKVPLEFLLGVLQIERNPEKIEVRLRMFRELIDYCKRMGYAPSEINSYENNPMLIYKT